jgi:hypothetical protein
MRRATIMLLMLAAGRLPAADQKLDEEQSKLLEEARRESLMYSMSLPDFLCTEVIHRREDPRGDGRWRGIDTLNVRLSYLEHKENYKLISINGKPTDIDYLNAGGALTTGEFGNRLIALFVPASKAEFEWKGWTRIHGRHAAVYHYRIAKENSTFLIQAGPTPTGPDAIVAAYRGEVSIDEETHRVLRLTAVAEIPLGFIVKESSLLIEYDFRKVGGKEFLVPVHADSSMKRGSYRTENQADFREYRKFQGESSISFDLPDEKKAEEKKVGKQ